MQQNLRGSMYLMNRELRSAGYNPTKLITNYVSFVTNFLAPNNFVSDVNYTTDHSMVAFTLDTNGNGAIDPSSNEQLAYRFNGYPLKAGQLGVGHVLYGTEFSHEFSHPTEDRPTWDFGRKAV